MTATNSSWVYNEVEVKLTGRTASKQIETVNRRSGQKTVTEQLLYEITPKNNEDGSWKKWVDLNSLYEIKGDK